MKNLGRDILKALDENTKKTLSCLMGMLYFLCQTGYSAKKGQLAIYLPFRVEDASAGCPTSESDYGNIIVSETHIYKLRNKNRRHVQCPSSV